MKNLLIIALILFMSISIFSQNEVVKTKDTRIGIIGNIWHPVGLIFNKSFGEWGFYVTAKSNFERQQSPSFNQYNFTGGLTWKIFTNTSSNNVADLMVGASYNTNPDNLVYSRLDSDWGIEALIMMPFTDRNFRVIGGWSSNSNKWADGVTAGFVYQF